MRKVTFFNRAPSSHAKGAITKAGITVIGAALTLLGLTLTWPRFTLDYLRIGAAQHTICLGKAGAAS